MAITKAASAKQQEAEGVPVAIPDETDRHKDGVPVAVPEDDSDSEPKSGQSAASTKE